MRKFKLIKKYPNSPELGTEVSFRLPNSSSAYYNDFCKAYRRVHLKDCLENSEFWEEVVEFPIGTKVLNTEIDTVITKEKDGYWYGEPNKTAYTDKMIATQKKFKVIQKDYEILSFVRDNLSEICKGTKFHLDSKTGLYNPPFKTSNLSLEHCLNGGFDIQSVKRLSDAEIFTVGDMIAHSYKGKDSEIITAHRKIEKIYFIEPIRIAIYVGEGLNLGLNSLSKLKPIFKTEDGVDIFEGDDVWYVAVNEDKNIECSDEYLAFNKFKWKTGRPSFSANYKWFSTEEKAEEFVMLNKPCLSINEITQNEKIRGNLGFEGSCLQKGLKELVKQKINANS